MMKKIFLFINFFTIILLSAQTTFGIKGGYLLSGMKIGDQQIKNKSYFYIGGFAEKRISEKFSLQGEILYTEPGGKHDYELYQIVNSNVEIQGVETATFKFPQIQIPVIAKYFATKNFSLGLGLNFGININPTIENYYLFPNPIAASQPQENIKTINIFPLLNMEYQFSNIIFADVRYNFNFFRINNNSSISENIAMLQIGLGYKFK